MSSFALYFDQISYYDTAAEKKYSAAELMAFRGELPSTNIDKIVAELRVEEKPFDDGKPYEWNPSIIQFQTMNSIQYLYIILTTSSAHNGKPRFHLHGATSEIPDHLLKIQHRPVGQFVDLPKYAPFPKDTGMIKVFFKMPGNQTTPLFKFDVIVWDNAVPTDVPCDPQVGNEPP
ncbi:MAG: hypothetical protein ACOY82_01505 [Pseudomonadota bacterium]